jgi:hypothetical protein
VIYKNVHLLHSQTLLESVGVNNVLGVAINTVAGKRHLVADVAKTLAQTYGSTSSVCGVAFCGNCTSWELFGNSSGTLGDCLGTIGNCLRILRELCGNSGNSSGSL